MLSSTKLLWPPAMGKKKPRVSLHPRHPTIFCTQPSLVHESRRKGTWFLLPWDVQIRKVYGFFYPGMCSSERYKVSSIPDVQWSWGKSPISQYGFFTRVGISENNCLTSHFLLLFTPSQSPHTARWPQCSSEPFTGRERGKTKWGHTQAYPC